MCVCKSMKNRCMDRMRNFSKVSKKQKKKKKSHEEIEFHNSIQDRVYRPTSGERNFLERIKTPIFLEAVAAIEII